MPEMKKNIQVYYTNVADWIKKMSKFNVVETLFRSVISLK